MQATAAGGGTSACASIPDENDVDCDGYGIYRAPYDNCPDIANPSQRNADAGYTETSPEAADGGTGMTAGDAAGDACDTDDDADGVPDRNADGTPLDNCPTVRNPGQQADACPPRDGPDGDGVPQDVDNCPNSTNPDQANYDRDDLGDPCDDDDDNDRRLDGQDNCQFASNFEQGDADGNGRGTACDPDEVYNRPLDPADVGGPPDRDSPALSLAARSRRHAPDLLGVLVTGVGCSEACGLSAQLLLTRRDARRLRLGSTALGTASARLGERGAHLLQSSASRVVRRGRAGASRATASS